MMDKKSWSVSEERKKKKKKSKKRKHKKHRKKRYISLLIHYKISGVLYLYGYKTGLSSLQNDFK